MSVSVSMPQLGESVTEGTVTRWLKREGEHVNADEPLLEVSTDKVDTEIPSPVSGVLRGITVAEDETVAVGAQLAVIDEEGSGGGAARRRPPRRGRAGRRRRPSRRRSRPAAAVAAVAARAGVPAAATSSRPRPSPRTSRPRRGRTSPRRPLTPVRRATRPSPATSSSRATRRRRARPDPYQYQPPAQQGYQPGYEPQSRVPAAQGYQQPGTNPYQPAAEAPSYPPAPPASAPRRRAPVPGRRRPRPDGPAGGDAEPSADGGPGYANGAESPYVTPLVRKLAAENGIDLARVSGTGVGGRIRKQDVLDAARSQRGEAPPPPRRPRRSRLRPPPSRPGRAAGPAQQAAARRPRPSRPRRTRRPPRAPPARPSRVPVPESALRGTTERMSRARQVIAQRMVESLQTSAQLTTVVEADVTVIARLRERAKAAFEAREGVKLSFLPFFALAVVESLKAHPKLNAVIDTASGQVTYHADEHLGIAVDTDRGLMVPVIRKAGDLNIAGLARKIADLAARTRAGQVSPDDLAGGTFTLTNTGSRGALFDTPIINQPQVGILGTGTVVKRAVVVEDPALGEVITVRSMVYLALTYDHRLVDGADAARFLTTLKARLEEGAYETELGL